MGKRERRFDVARGIAMMLVVLGHCHQRQIERFVCLFHMPVFLFISGFFWRDENLDDLKGFIVKRFKGLYLPYLIYEIIFFCLRPLFLLIGWYDSSSIEWGFGALGYLKEFVKIVFLMGREQLLGAFWYLVMLLMLEVGYWIISYLVRKIFSGREDVKFGMVFSVYLAGCLLARYIRVPRIGPALIGIPFFYIGYLSRKYEIKVQYKLIPIAASFVFLVFCSSYGGAALGTVTINDPPFQLVCGCVGVYLVLGISKFICEGKGRWTYLFDLVGKNTITVMAFHEIGFKLLTTFFVSYQLKIA